MSIATMKAALVGEYRRVHWSAVAAAGTWVFGLLTKTEVLTVLPAKYGPWIVAAGGVWASLAQSVKRTPPAKAEG